ncbi:MULTISPECIES: hypothetical protein [unclassified Mesorhizobium]|uniref:hypothetical protein n=1 Tax=unclassified Mesorhizobium TaxID=325217 RepID=UPI000FCBEC7E|nr:MULTISPECIES: hypothetical protein [unclassified Mesorhizobium]RUW98404.1 hypothetical protein EOA30_25955 [Mesorhizobium sp. M8A.F.Ca.ET.059.01.1.1]RUW53362.1 hypothetical protein EOA36_10760 [Mesorhizobium sp. M8A.F.Ca.ET.021.01.1.1]TGP95505.1 hypothetical protein EN861_11425 [Mesorhizobium sp. M8A.F.Ca.ET.218.01.1.1]TGT18559.1 hypothetical protein EN856_11440 [Mesorhizobium sp. M8A.F.Ca.ET.213.01.1.1]TGT89571.1 hypothetical protein EN804_11800 [Mesorhizobium sp. M8A.F.Ca.ET.161.01.1.1]
MIEKTSAELQREAEIARANVSDTAESIRNKMTPGQLIDEFSGLFASGDSSSMLGALKSQVGANPLPVALVGVGLMWLMAGQGAQKPSAVNGAPRSTVRPDFADDLGAVDRPFDTEGLTSGVSGALSGAIDKAKSIVEDAADGVRSSMAGAASSVSDSASQYGASTVDQASKATAAAVDLIRQEPLVLAAVGLAFGTAVGAMLPRTDFEDQQIGKTSDAVRDKANELLHQGVEGAKDVAAQAYQTVKDEADKKGFSTDPASIIDTVADVVQTAGSETEKAVRGKISDASRERAK